MNIFDNEKMRKVVMKQKADLIVDLQFGSTGKGALAGYLADRNDYDMVINCNMPNAGHTYIDAKGNKMLHKVLPNGIVSKNIKWAMLGPASIFSIEQLEKEMSQSVHFGYSHYHLVIHENACVVTDFDKQHEERHMSDIGSTKQGTSAVMIDKIKRHKLSDPTVRERLKGNGLLTCVVTNAEWMGLIAKADNILLEGAQGFSLGINAGFYPFCTSRDCTPAAFLSGMGVPIPMLRKTIGTCRMHPIRVGGNSGPCYNDQIETSWEKLELEKEFTTVTGRERRVFTWSQKQIEEAMFACQPDEVFLNFCNYDPDEVPIIRDRIAMAAIKAGCTGHVRYEGWGATVNDIREQMELYKDG